MSKTVILAVEGPQCRLLFGGQCDLRGGIGGRYEIARKKTRKGVAEVRHEQGGQAKGDGKPQIMVNERARF